MSGSTHTERVRSESPLLWPALALLVIAVACFTVYWDGHRSQFPYSTAHSPMIWPPPPEPAVPNSPPSGRSVKGLVDLVIPPEPAVPNSPPSTAPTLPSLGNFTGIKLPDGTQLKVPEQGIESKLTTFILDNSKPADKTTWFDFDRLLFDTGKATLQPASQEQLQNIASILNAFPQVHARIGGYTDNTGDAAANLELSGQRAANVMNELVKLGVNGDRLDAKGYGAEHPVADNSSEAGRAKNRRISLRVTAK